VKSNIWDIAAGGSEKTPRDKRRRKSVADILRAAYLATTRDALTRQAVKRVLR
jgi:hypothetical protein